MRSKRPVPPLSDNKRCTIRSPLQHMLQLRLARLVALWYFLSTNLVRFRIMNVALRFLSLVLIFLWPPYPAGALAFHDEAAVKRILQQRIEEQKKGVAIVVGLVDESGSKVISYG